MKKLTTSILLLLLCSVSLFAQSVPTVTPYTRIDSTSELKEGDIVVFVSESPAAVGGAIYQTYLPAVTENLKIDATNGKAEIPSTAQTFTMSKYNSNWQFTATGTTNRMLLDISGKGAFTYGEPDENHLAGWGISISNGVAEVSRPDEGQSFPVRFNVDRFKPYKSGVSAGSDICLYKKSGDAHEITSSLALANDINFGDVELGEKKTVEVNYTAENLTDDIAAALSLLAGKSLGTISSLLIYLE